MIIGIVTLQNSNNYGAMYQVYALSKYLKNLGYDVFILDYEMTRDNANLLNYIKNPISFFKKILYRREQVISKIFKKKNTIAKINRKEGFINIFRNFRGNYLNITKEEYNYQKLVKNCPKADAYICGSDQIWAADFLFTSPAFLLGFVPNGTKKISYAASFGKNEIESYLNNVFSKYINKFDAISVREKSAISIVEKFSKLEPIHVLDPTLLLKKEDYLEIIDYSLVPDESYIFVYKLNQDKELSDWMDKSINLISEKNNHSVLAVSTNLIYPFDGNYRELHPTPGQLLGLIEKSSLTVTNSFHGTVFSIILQTKFLSFSRDSYKDKQNVRIEELLSNLNLEKFYCEPFLDVKEVYKKLSIENNYKNVFEKLAKMRNISENFIEKALKVERK